MTQKGITIWRTASNAAITESGDGSEELMINIEESFLMEIDEIPWFPNVGKPSRTPWMRTAMRLKIAEQDIASTLKPLGFQMQSRQNDVTFVRPNATIASLFERIECMYAGRTIVPIGCLVGGATHGRPVARAHRARRMAGGVHRSGEWSRGFPKDWRNRRLAGASR
jgi:hypothetical protein